jgi:hypothetical protein
VPKLTKKRLELEQAVAELRASDPVLRALIDRVGIDALGDRRRVRPRGRSMDD